MSRESTDAQIDAKVKRLLGGMVTRGLLQRRGESRGAYYEAAQKKRAIARSNGRPPVSGPLAPDSGRKGGQSRTKSRSGRQ